MPQELPPLINGVQYSFASIRTNALSVSLAGLLGIEWDQMLEIEDIYATGNQVNSRSYGSNKATSTLTILLADLLALQKSAPQMNISKIPPFNIIVTLQEGADVVAFELRNVQFKGYKFAAKQGDMKIPITLPLILTEVARTR